MIACYTFPYVFVLVANALERMPGELEDASAILGGGRWDTARRVALPMALPALLAGALVAFLQAMTLFGSPAILALAGQVPTITTKIWSLFQKPPKPELAAAAALPLLGAHGDLAARRTRDSSGGAPMRCSAARTASRAWCGSAPVAGWRLASAWFLRAAQPGVFALRRAAQGGLLEGGVGRSSAVQQLHLPAPILRIHRAPHHPARAARNTLTIGLLTATIGHRAGPGHVLSHRTRGRDRARALGALATAPVAIPGIVLGVGLFLAYTRPPIVLYGTRSMLLLAFLTVAMPAAYQQMQAAFGAIHPEFEDASRILGATRLRALRQITAPLLRSTVIATWCFMFVGTIREFSAAMMLTTSETKVVSILISASTRAAASPRSR